MMARTRPQVVTALAAAVAVFAPAMTPAPAAGPPSSVVIEVVSNRADLVSGGDALVEVGLPADIDPADVRMRLDDHDVTDAFAVRPNGRFQGLVTGLEVGENTLTAVVPRRRGARITITNHPASGPVFAGPQVQPWLCTTEQAGLGPPTDQDCSAPVAFDFLYSPTSHPTVLLPYDPASPPVNVATTTTDEGQTVPFIVRRERGTLDRGIYDIWVLYDPDQPWAPWAPQRGWNHKLLYRFGGNCSPNHNQTEGGTELEGRYIDSIDDAIQFALSRGYALATSGLNILGNNCNTVVAAESMMMVKERLVEAYGPIRYTIGDGLSGGAIQQHQIAANYPGLLDGLRPQWSFPDIWTVLPEIFDCALIEPYFDANPTLWPLESQRTAVTGQAPSATSLSRPERQTACQAWLNAGFHLYVGDPRLGCAGEPPPGPPSQPDYAYDPQTNQDGARCTLQDYQAAIFGSDGDTGWAPRPFDNVGVQYGLKALAAGEISAEQFVDLNAEIGGLDLDLQPTPGRSEADPHGLAYAYRSGQVTHAGELDTVPIIDIRSDGNNDLHESVYTAILRARLEAANGHHHNQVHWRSPTALTAHPPVIRDSMRFMDQWLASIEADTTDTSLAEKVVRHRPDGLNDACFTGGQPVPPEVCATLVPDHALPRLVAGAPLRNDVLKCALTPLDPADYAVEFTGDQWARLQAAFPTGVCDWSRPGVGQQPPPGPWMTYADGPGGRPLGDPPVSRPLRRGGGHR